VQIVFYFVPKSSHAQRFLQTLVEEILVVNSVQAQTNDNIFADRHGRKRIRFLKNHTHAAPNNRGVDSA
jgi:hypothetical protein